MALRPVAVSKTKTGAVLNRSHFGSRTCERATERGPHVTTLSCVVSKRTSPTSRSSYRSSLRNLLQLHRAPDIQSDALRYSAITGLVYGRASGYICADFGLSFNTFIIHYAIIIVSSSTGVIWAALVETVTKLTRPSLYRAWASRPRGEATNAVTTCYFPCTRTHGL